MEATSDLWGDLPVDANLRPPIVFLREQATILTERTKGLLRGELSSLRAAPALQAALDIVAPGLQNYRYRVLLIEHAIAFYPVRIQDVANGVVMDAKSEEEYLKALARILGSPTVHQVVGALVSQIRALSPDLAE